MPRAKSTNNPSQSLEPNEISYLSFHFSFVHLKIEVCSLRYARQTNTRAYPSYVLIRIGDTFGVGIISIVIHGAARRAVWNHPWNHPWYHPWNPHVSHGNVFSALLPRFLSSKKLGGSHPRLPVHAYVHVYTSVWVIECRNDRRNAKKTLGTITEGDERITAFLWIIEVRSSLLENINGAAPSLSPHHAPDLFTLLDRNTRPCL